MEKLKNKLNDIIDKINKIPLSNQEELAFFRDRIQIDGNLKIKNINKYSNSDLMTLILRVENKDTLFEEIKEDIDSLKSDLDLTPLTVLYNIFDYLFQSDLNEDFDQKEVNNIYWEYIKYLKENEFWQKCIIETEPFLKDKNKFDKLVFFFNKYKSSSMILKILEFDSCTYLIEKGVIEEIVTLVQTGDFTQIGNPKNIKKLKKKLEATKELKKLAEEEELADLIEDVRQIDKFIDQVSSHIMKLEKIKRTQIKEKNKKLGLYSNFINMLPSLTAIKYEDISFIDDEEFKKEIICKILEKNKNKYLDLIDEYRNNKKFEINEFDKLLLKYNIKISDEYHKTVVANNIDIDILKAKLNILQEKCFDFIRKDETILVKVLLFSPAFAIEKIKIWVDKEIVPKEFLMDNINVLMSTPKDLNEQLTEIYEKSKIVSQFDIINNNIDLFKKNNICLQNIKKYNVNLFLENSDKLTIVLDLLHKYNIELNSNNLIDFSILTSPKKIDIIDAFIEIGMFEYLKEHVELINKDMTFIKKIILLNELGYSIFDENNSLLNIITNDNKFYVPDNELDLYIANDTLDYMNLDCYIALEEGENVLIREDINDDPLISMLETNFKLDNNIYYFDGISISRNKVLRNMTTLRDYDFEGEIDNKEMLITSILFDSILDEKYVVKIVDSINDKIEPCKIQIKKEKTIDKIKNISYNHSVN